MIHIPRLCGTLFALLVCASMAIARDMPKRVVSINLCTDQLALLLAAPGQLVSVSRRAHDPTSSSMADKARAFPANGSSAEEVYLLKPDLVLAGTFTSTATINMLRKLGIRVERFAPARALQDVPARLMQMGEALGQRQKATDMITAFQTRLAGLSDAPTANRPRAALTNVNNYSSGDGTLSGDILRVAGFDNVAAEIGLTSVGRLGLEALIMLAPDIIIQGRNYPGYARAEDNLDHPALHALKGTRVAGHLTNSDWICGTPNVLEAIETMRDLRLQFEASP